METVFVTGAAGLIGSAVCDMLLKKGFAVIGTDSRPLKIYDHNFRFVQCEITDKDTVTAAMRDATILVHLACSVDNDFTAILSSADEKIATQVDKYLYKTAVQYEYTRILMLSSHQVYMVPKTREPVRESFDLKPVTIYGKIKLDSENALKNAVKKTKNITVIMRTTPIYTKTFLDNLRSKVQDPKDGSYFVYGYGDYGYSFCCLYNLVDFISAVLAAEDTAKLSGEYNVTDTKPIMAKDLMEVLKTELNISIVQSRNYSSDNIKGQFSLFGTRNLRTDYRFSDPSIACSNISYDNTKAQRISAFRWKLSNTK
ncbi:MAG: NAD(P)-dependent oxidoreductase [Oscillospiraceae bacterium]|nr:NAD(P)-dependent oxidoreductase [Oscillospiraceae bacterium]